MEQGVHCRKRGRMRSRRCVRAPPVPLTFKPRSTPMTELEVLQLRVEELEAIRLVDLLGMDLESASESMKVSRRTLTRDLKNARKKVARMFVEGKAIVIEGGDYTVDTEERE